MATVFSIFSYPGTQEKLNMRINEDFQRLWGAWLAYLCSLHSQSLESSTPEVFYKTGEQRSASLRVKS